MKKTIFILMLLIATMFTTAQPLGFMGSNDWPAEQLMVTKFDDYQSGDIIYSAYVYENEYYASEKHVLPAEKLKNFFIKGWKDTDDSPLKTGIYSGESLHYFVYREGEFYRLDVEITGDFNEAFKAATLTVTNEVAVVHDNLWYSQCPEWPAVTEVYAYKAIRKYYYNSFAKFIPMNHFMPKYYDKATFEIVTGTGRLRAPRPGTMDLPIYWSYMFTGADLARGYIVLHVKVTPFKNCEGGQLEKDIKVILKK